MAYLVCYNIVCKYLVQYLACDGARAPVLVTLVLSFSYYLGIAKQQPAPPGWPSARGRHRGPRAGPCSAGLAAERARERERERERERR